MQSSDEVWEAGRIGKHRGKSATSLLSIAAYILKPQLKYSIVSAWKPCKLLLFVARMAIMNAQVCLCYP